MSIRYVVVVPVYKHPVLVVDALRSLLAQEVADEMKVVVIDDGCPYRETVETLAAFQAAHPDRISVYRQKNRGLSGARNTGIEIALRRYPDAEGIYFLDADNILEPWALKHAGEACRNHPEADWFFPDIYSFGVNFRTDCVGPYSILEHLEHNYCEAGSFVRMRVFEAGVRFDETMKLGYEDWDFWLQAVTRGFRGRHLPDAGFRYRKRGESMLSDSDRDRPEILGYMRRKYKKAFSPKKLLDLETTDRPRSLFIDVERRQFSLGLEAPIEPGGEAESIGDEELAARLADHSRTRLGLQTYFSSRAVWTTLARGKVLKWALWEMERLQSSADVVVLRIEPSERHDRIKITDEPFHPADGHMLLMSTRLLAECAADAEGTWIASLAGPNAAPTTRCVTVHIPQDFLDARLHGEVPVLREALALIEWLRIRRRTYMDRKAWVRNIDMRLGLSKPLDPHGDWHQIRHAFPHRRPVDSCHVGLVLPLATFGGVERVAHQTARVLRARGMVPHLIVAGANEFTIPSEFRDVYETLRLYREERHGEFGWSHHEHFYGTPLPYLEQGRIPELAGLCADLDVVINNHSGALSFALGTLRRAGVLTACSQHVFDLVGGGRPAGHPLLALAFEHAYDAVLPVSQQMAAQLHGLGIPRDKIIRVQNAGGFVIDEDQVAEVLEARRGRSGPLRCLFMGRLDPQKGVDRLGAIIRSTREVGADISWRVVGRAVLHRESDVSSVEGVAIEPPVVIGSEIAELLSWADAVVMPSRYEGLPLLAHEAMSFGCVVVAADAGAIRESVSDGETGYVIPQEEIVTKSAELLALLASNRVRLMEVALQASASASARSWEASIEPLIGWIEVKRMEQHQEAAA